MKNPLFLYLFYDRIVGMDRPVPDEVILGLLKAQPAHGYELLECFRSRTQLGRIWTMSTSQIYAVLKRLERAGAIEGKALSTDNAPPRTEYKITAVGDDLLVNWLYDPKPSPSIHRIRVLFLSRIYISNLLNFSHKEIVAAQIASCQTQKEIFVARLQSISSDIEKLTIEFVINQLNSAIHWLEESKFNI